MKKVAVGIDDLLVLLGLVGRLAHYYYPASRVV